MILIRLRSVDWETEYLINRFIFLYSSLYNYRIWWVLSTSIFISGCINYFMEDALNLQLQILSWRIPIFIIALSSNEFFLMIFVYEFFDNTIISFIVTHEPVRVSYRIQIINGFLSAQKMTVLNGETSHVDTPSKGFYHVEGNWLVVQRHERI